MIVINQNIDNMINPMSCESKTLRREETFFDVKIACT